MSIFAGVLVRNPSKNIPGVLIQELRAALSRHPEDAGKVQEFTDGRVFMAKLDLGALGTAGEYFAPGLAALVAGDPLFQPEPGQQPQPRAESLEILVHDVLANDHQRLRTFRGTFCAVTYDQSSEQLHLITDKLGIRPIYCWVLPDFAVFATALRILEAVTVFDKTMDLQGVSEALSYGITLADRTPYQGILSLLAGEVIRFDGVGAMQRTQYWRWDDLPLAEPSEVPAGQRIYQQFQEAVELRLKNEKVAAAHLSGGLDSRAIVAALRAADAEVFTVNYSQPNSQDHILGELASERLSTHHTFIPSKSLIDGDCHRNDHMRDWLDSPQYLSHQPRRPRVVWSGDGGSVGMGHVHLNADIVEAAREGNLESAADIFMAYNNCGISSKLINKEIALNMSRLARAGILAELRDLKPVDTGRIFHLFLMLNDQRRHMGHYFENMDIMRVEFELPFFDSEFLSAILREKIDPFLRHAFYLDWLQCFPAGVAETPWQAYPSHVPCPHPLPKGLEYQWDEATKKRKRTVSSVLLAQARSIAGESRFAREFLNYGRMRVFIALLLMRRNEYEYLLQAPALLHLYWGRSNGAAKLQGMTHQQKVY